MEWEEAVGIEGCRGNLLTPGFLGLSVGSAKLETKGKVSYVSPYWRKGGEIGWYLPSSFHRGFRYLHTL
jgi:hypothetical protein